MEVIYKCGVCKKEHKTKEGAAECEAKHKKQQEERQKLKVEKKSRIKAISDIVSNFVKDYNEFPPIYVESGNSRWTGEILWMRQA